MIDTAHIPLPKKKIGAALFLADSLGQHLQWYLDNGVSFHLHCAHQNFGLLAETLGYDPLQRGDEAVPSKLLTRDQIRAKVMANVRIDPDTGCWIWLGPTSGDKGRGRDYPRMYLRGQTCAVHRVMFTNEFGYLPGKIQLDHTCRQRRCVNPYHLEPVTHRENCRRRDSANGRPKPAKRARKAKQR